MTRISMALVPLLLTLLPSIPAQAEVHSKTITYHDGAAELQGYLAWDDAFSGKRPGVMVVHEWWGLNDYARKRADMLARLGYVAFAADMYGAHKVTQHPDEAGAWMKQITANIDNWQRRALLGLDILRGQDSVDPTRLAAIGYCFGGATVMEMAYSGADLKGVVSFHGSLPVATPEQAAKIKAKIMVAHGQDDSFESPEQIAQFKGALDKAGADWFMVIYGGARHSFTNPDAAKFGIPNLQYNKEADTRSWAQMELFLNEIFGGGTS